MHPRISSGISLVLVVVASLTPQGTFAAGQVIAAQGCFTDVQASHPDALAICTFKERGIVSGIDGAQFLPDTPIRRAEAFKILKGEFDCAEETGLCDKLKSNPFSDLADKHSLKKWVLYFYYKGYIQGYDASHAGPDNYLTEAEAVKIALNFNNIDVPASQSGETYGLPGNSDLISYIDHALWKNLLRDDFSGFNAGRAMTRGKFTTLQYRIQYLQDNNEEFFDDWKNGFVSCHDIKYYEGRAEYDLWHSRLAATHIGLEAYDMGNLCKMDDGNMLVTFAHWNGSDPSQGDPGQSIVMFDNMNRVVGETEDFYCVTAGDLRAPIILSKTGETVEFACISGDAGYILVEQYTLALTDFSYELQSSDSYTWDGSEWQTFAKTLDH